ncbi:hypothetical protein W97_00699 [Coniosporium apollinis CBS 100218]|uniref:Rab-GAP TBC domain-containing protein n=1 Tax=Coniosporium apollinis (strain CBS 100218) TaxID=1168221 RepID=R7YI48_CONA1|nr:uncharacterized protein W97_00699 [Coniosporium apollinis CBS 100218]EON61484.1 hypothetical protein W97_00699 [Coniosporium apollinis CBS 100218]
MDVHTDDQQPRRTSSHASTSSSRKSSTVRLKPRKHASNASLHTAPTAEDKSFTSFPSLSPSPEASPSLTTARPDPFKPTTSHIGHKPVDSKARKIPKNTQSLVGSLVTRSPSGKGRSALFDDSPQDARYVPGNLHHASDEHIEHVLARAGAVALVRQLAEDLAQRDAQMTSLRRRAEERESILKKMLRECEVSSLNIETRLRESERALEQSLKNGNKEPIRPSQRRSRGSSAGMGAADTIDSILIQALRDKLPSGADMDVDDNSLLLPGDPSPNADRISVNLTANYPPNAGETTKGWKTYLWNGNATSKKASRSPSVISRNEEDMVRTRLRADSAAQPRRKALNSDVFRPPAPGIHRTVSGSSSLHRVQSDEPDNRGDARSRRPSLSVTNWALRLVAGNNQANRDIDKQGILRGRPASISNETDSNKRAPSMGSTRTTQSAKVPSTINGATAKAPVKRTSLGPHGTLKRTPTDSLRSALSTLGPVSPPAVPRRNSNLGPVEMDQILPEETRPPTLMQLHSTTTGSAEYLLDRFGFIYDQRRKKRQNDAAAALQKHRRVESLGNNRHILTAGNVGEAETTLRDSPSTSEPATRPASMSSADHQTEQEPTTRWHDFLKLATFPTELLSHTPSAAPITSIDSVEVVDDTTSKTSHIVVQKRGSVPALSTNPEPAPSRVVSGNAEFAHSSASEPTTPADPTTKPPDPVKALLEQLTELHDSLQRERTVKWNEFLRRVRAERKREGQAAGSAEGRPKNISGPEASLADGEMIGVAGLGNKGKVGRAKWNEFKHLVLGGIPVAYRAKIWAECSGASAMRVPGYYEDLVSSSTDDPDIVSQIQMDIPRTLTDNIFFRRGPGRDKLNEVLLAYSRRNPEVGYCQGMNLITACLLLIMPTAEDAFWILATMIENILPPNYYDHSLLTSRADQQVLRQYVAEILPKLSAHLDDLGIELEALTFQWFLSVFTDCLSAEALFRVWDVVLCMHDGSTFLFQVALALLKLNERSLIECDNPAAVYHYINHQMTNHAISIDGLIQASELLKKVVKRADMEERRARAVEKEREAMRVREEARAERAAARKGKARVVEVPELGAGSSGPNGRESLTPTQAMHDVSNGVRYGPETSESTVKVLEEVEDAFADLQVKTPMPIDEEAMWRA